MRVAAAFVSAAFAIVLVAELRAQDGPEPMTLAELDARPLVRRSEILPALRLDEWASPVNRRVTIELPEPFGLRASDEGLVHSITYEIGFGSPRFSLFYAHPDDVLGADARPPDPDHDVVTERGERGSLSWYGTWRTMRPHALRRDRSFMRPLPPGERTWIELSVVTHLVGADGVTLRCSATLAPFARARHVSRAHARDWILGRCATAALEGDAPVAPAR